MPAPPIGYDAILAVVIVELVFAFGIGISCIVFSFNLFRELNNSDVDVSPVGDLPNRQSLHRKPTIVSAVGSDNDYNTFDFRHTIGTGSGSGTTGTERNSEYDIENDIPNNVIGSPEHQAPRPNEVENAPQEEGYMPIVQSFLEYIRVW